MFAEALPDGCPPAEAIEPQQMTVYRLLETQSPCATDFASHAARWPDRYGSRCIEYAVSVYTQRDDLSYLLGMPVHRNKVVGRLTLSPISGRIQKTGKRSHHSWWRYQGFDAISACEVEE